MSDLYASQVQEMLSDLRDNSAIVVDSEKVRAPATEANIATALTMAQYKLPDGIEDFYAEMNGFSVTWSSVETTEGGSPLDSGSINILPIEQVFASWQGTIWFAEFEGGDRFRPVRPFDLFAPEACMAFWQPLDDCPEDDVYFHYIGEDVSATGYGFEEYMSRLIECRGYRYWQTTVFGVGDQPEANHFRERAPQLFPGLDLARFAPAQA